jgi:hypothetical protein
LQIEISKKKKERGLLGKAHGMEGGLLVIFIWEFGNMRTYIVVVQGQFQHIFVLIDFEYFMSGKKKILNILKISLFSLTKFCSLKFYYLKIFSNNIIGVKAAKVVWVHCSYNGKAT